MGSIAEMTGSDRDGHRRATLARLSSGVLFTNVLAAVALLATTVLTARAFGPGGRGEFTLATQFATLVVALGSLGLGAAAAYHTARGKWPTPVAFGNSTLFGLLLGLAIAGVCDCVVLVGDATFKGLPKVDLVLALLALPFALAVGNVQAIYQGLRNFRTFNTITVTQAALPLLLIGVAIAFGGGVRAAIVATVAAFALLFVAVVIYARRSIRFAWRVNQLYARALVSYGVRAHPANVLAFLGYRLDVFLVDGYKGAAAVGLYGAGVVIAEGLWMPSQAVSTALFPTIAAEPTESARRSITPLVARNTLWLTTMLAAVLAVAAGAVVDVLYSSRFSASAGAVRALTPGIVLFSAARVLGNDIAARGRPLVNSVIAAASVVCNIALNVVLIPRFGIDGAAWASTGSYSVVYLATAVVYGKIADVPLRALVVPTREDGARYVRLGKRLAGRKPKGALALPDEATPPKQESVPADAAPRKSS
jgi:O-antigen/teichoic acid export membrane protein